MATNFPTSLDTLTNPSATDTLDSPPHDEQHADANDAIEAIQAKVGIDSSAVTTSLDYRVGQLELGGGSMTTSSTAPSSPSDGDMWYDTDDGRTYVYYDDGTSAQWVEFGAPAVAHGKILQVVSSYTQTSFQTSSGSYVDASLSATITPSSASSNILVILTAPYKIYRETSIVQARAKVLRDSTDISGDITQEIDAATASGRSANASTFSFSKLDSPATTSATTYKLQTRVVYTANNAYVRWHANGSSLTLLEVSA